MCCQHRGGKGYWPAGGEAASPLHAGAARRQPGWRDASGGRRGVDRASPPASTETVPPPQHPQDTSHSCARATRLWEDEALAAHARNHAHLHHPLRAGADGDAARHQAHLPVIPLLGAPRPRLQRRVARHRSRLAKPGPEPALSATRADYRAHITAQTRTAHTGRASAGDPRCTPEQAGAQDTRLGAAQRRHGAGSEVPGDRSSRTRANSSCSAACDSQEEARKRMRCATAITITNRGTLSTSDVER